MDITHLMKQELSMQRFKEILRDIFLVPYNLILSTRSDLRFGDSKMYNRLEKDVERLYKYKEKIDEIPNSKNGSDIKDYLTDEEYADFIDICSNISYFTVDNLEQDEVFRKFANKGVPYTVNLVNTGHVIIHYPKAHDKDIEPEELARSLNVQYNKWRNGEAGIIYKETFDEMIEYLSKNKEPVEYSCMKNVDEYKLYFLREQFKKLGILVGKEKSRDNKNKVNLYFKNENALKVLRAIYSTEYQLQNAYGKTLDMLAQEKIKDDKEIMRVSSNFDDVTYICSTHDDQYYKIDANGISQYVDGKLVGEKIPRTDAKKFNQTLNNFKYILPRICILDEAQFKQDFAERKKLFSEIKPDVGIDTMNETTMEFLAENIQKSDFIRKFVDKNLTIKNRDILYGEKGIPQIILLQTDYLRKNAICNEKQKRSIFGGPEAIKEFGEAKDKVAEASHKLEIQKRDFLEAIIEAEDIKTSEEKRAISEKLSTFFNELEKINDLEDLVNLVNVLENTKNNIKEFDMSAYQNLDMKIGQERRDARDPELGENNKEYDRY